MGEKINISLSQTNRESLKMIQLCQRMDTNTYKSIVLYVVVRLHHIFISVFFNILLSRGEYL